MAVAVQGGETIADSVMRTTLKTLCLGTAIAAFAAGAATAGAYNNAASYNTPYGMTPGQETQPINPSLRDANGNLTVVNGQFTSSTMSQQSGVQTAGTSVNGSGGSNGTGAMFGGATAIGNSLNVITYGSNNTVIVNSKQTNNGNQEANVSINGQ